MSADRQVAQFFECGGMGDSVQDRASTFRLKSKGNKSGKATGLVLKFAQASQMIDPVRGSFDVTVEHGTGAVAPHLVPGSVHFSPFFGAFLAPADLVANLRIKDLGAAAGNRTQSVLPEKLKGITEGKFEDALGEVSNLDGGERLDDQLLVESVKVA